VLPSTLVAGNWTMVWTSTSTKAVPPFKVRVMSRVATYHCAVSPRAALAWPPVSGRLMRTSLAVGRTLATG
jgi:hypothetical protein